MRTDCVPERLLKGLPSLNQQLQYMYLFSIIFHILYHFHETWRGMGCKHQGSGYHWAMEFPPSLWEGDQESLLWGGGENLLCLGFAEEEAQPGPDFRHSHAGFHNSTRSHCCGYSRDILSSLRDGFCVGRSFSFDMSMTWSEGLHVATSPLR